ncbi:MAG: HAD-IC family P-type ATPase [Acidimicrobiales bacterium]
MPPSPSSAPPESTRSSGSAWAATDAVDVAAALEVDPSTGLSSAEVRERAERHGPNRLAEPPRRPRWLRFLDQFRSTLVLILAGAAVVALAFGDVKDPIIIGVVLLINAVLGYLQEAKAESALDALQQMLVATVRVRRDDAVTQVPADELVPGDVVLLEAGDRVPADGRILLAANAEVDEAAFTGESLPVAKSADPVADGAAALADQHSMAFLNTTVVRGRVELVVTEIGMATQMGRVAEMMHEADPGPTPLQVQLDTLGKRLAMVAVAAVSAVFVIQLLQGSDFADAMLGAVALAVAAIPEGLPAVVTVTLALGVRQMAIRNAIVKRLASVETLGSTSVICSDKTGTLTLNQMTARTVVRAGVVVHVDGEGYRPIGDLHTEGGVPMPEMDGALVAGLLCNDAALRPGDDGQPGLLGDPTEGAFLVLAAKGGFDPDAYRAEHPRVGEVPFDSTTKVMATFHRVGDEVLVAVKGAPDVLLAAAAGEADREGRPQPLDDPARARWAAANDDLARQGLRVLAVATRRLPAAEVLDADGTVAEPDRWIGELTLEALVGIVDPPRPEARDAIALCRTAGITVKMITGDHAVTAAAIAASLGIEGRAVTGADLDAMDDDELAREIAGIGVCARVSPEHKVRVVRALQANGEVVAMTGDGVNDAAALRNADIGVAMGITGTEVTKEAADMVLTDDNFATIVGAVERGRTIYDNIVTFVRFQLSTNLGAIATILGAGLVGLPVPFTPVQVLFVNIIADGPPAMTLGVDPPARGVMGRRPRAPGAAILSATRIARLAFFGLVMMVGTLGVLQWATGRYGSEVALTMAFTTFVLYQMVNVFNARAEHVSALSKDAFRNGKLWLAIAGVVGLQVAAVSVPFLQGVFDTTALTVGQWLICAVVASTVLWAEELRKLAVRLLRRASTTSDPAGVDPSAPAAPSGADVSPGAAAPSGAGSGEGAPSPGSIAPAGVASPPIPAAPVGATHPSGDPR